jgi:GDP/UDP-N,N'-diacetylbacillosamine 2-epimerase (hydrolysing)
MKRKICVVTGTRAEFGLLNLLMQQVQSSPLLDLSLIVTGMHLSPEFGSTYQEIEQAGFKINEKIEMLLSADTATAVTKSMGISLIGFADAYSRINPDLIVVLGDRFEILAAVTAALIAGIPIAHLHGGETTEGAFDEAIRHSITKMSHLHFVATDVYRSRVIQLGEHPSRVFNVGGLGVDAIKQTELLDKNELENQLDFKFGKKNLLVTFHPVTLDENSSTNQLEALLDALYELSDTHIIFTMPNADTGSRKLSSMVKEFVITKSNSKAYNSLGRIRYLSTLSFVDGVIGNSSSGLTEAPSMGVGTINIGERQKGRLLASSVINCDPNLKDIRAALRKLYSSNFQELIKSSVNPYGNGGACKSIVDIISKHPLDGILKKSFYDL